MNRSDPIAPAAVAPVLVWLADDPVADWDRCRGAVAVGTVLGEVHAVLVGPTGGAEAAPGRGDDAGDRARRLAGAGVAVLHTVDAVDGADATARALDAVADAVGTRTVLVPATVTGIEVGALLAHRRRCGLAVEAVDAELTDDARVVAHRSAFAGTWTTRVEIATERAVVAVRLDAAPARAASRPAPAPGAGLPVRHHTLPAEPGERAARTFQVVGRTPSRRAQDLARAQTVVVGGRGTGGDFGPVSELAQALGGVVGATGVATQEGWSAPESLVGRTGTTVTPRLYVGVGVSGAEHHVAGMERATTIVAVNKDPHAPIFDLAHIGVVGDLFAVLPQVTAELERLRAGSAPAA